MTQARRLPQRTCLGCRQVLDQAQLVRFVRSPGGEVVADLRGRLPGRGAYLCNSRSCVEAALRRRQFERAFRQECRPVSVEQLVESISREYLAHLGGLLGMARKSAKFIAGSNAVLDALSRKAPLSVVVLAKDISPQIGEKIRQRAAMLKITTTELFEKPELGRILGRAERSVVGLPDGKLADAFLEDLRRYQEIQGKVDG